MCLIRCLNFGVHSIDPPQNVQLEPRLFAEYVVKFKSRNLVEDWSLVDRKQRRAEGLTVQVQQKKHTVSRRYGDPKLTLFTNSVQSLLPRASIFEKAIVVVEVPVETFSLSIGRGPAKAPCLRGTTSPHGARKLAMAWPLRLSASPRH